MPRKAVARRPGALAAHAAALRKAFGVAAYVGRCGVELAALAVANGVAAPSAPRSRHFWTVRGTADKSAVLLPGQRCPAFSSKGVLNERR
jgi:hypothetical protein